MEISVAPKLTETQIQAISTALERYIGETDAQDYRRRLMQDCYSYALAHDGGQLVAFCALEKNTNGNLVHIWLCSAID